MASLIGGLITAATPLLISAARNYSIKYGPGVAQDGADKAEVFAKDANKEREFVRKKAIESYNLLTEDEYQQAIAAEKASKAPGLLNKPRPIKLCYQTIRMSRNVVGTEAFTGPIPFLAHWGVEVEGVYYELRDARNGGQQQHRHDGRVVLHEEIGTAGRGIKLQVTTNRTLHESTRFFVVGSTALEDEQIIRIAHLIFRRFGQEYDIMLDNCQLFARILAEEIGGKENIDEISRVIGDKSLLKLATVASHIAGPAYHLMATLHHALPKPHPDMERSEFLQTADRVLANFEKFYYHSHIYAARRGKSLPTSS